MPRPTSQDLAGFWDLLQLSIDDVTAKFDELQQIKSNQWRLVESPEKKVKLEAATPPPPKTLILTLNLYHERSRTRDGVEIETFIHLSIISLIVCIVMGYGTDTHKLKV